MIDARAGAQSLALVAAGGAAGAVSRYLLGRAVQHAAGGPFPWGTLAVNVLGCLAFGVVFAAVPPASPGAVRLHLLVLTGVLGGFTTFSAFSHETVQLLRAGHQALAFAYAAASLLACLAATALGAWLVQRLA